MHTTLAVSIAGTPTAGQLPVEYRQKAHFLAKFAGYVEWPADAFQSADAPLVLGVFGDFPFGTSLAEEVRGNSVHGHTITVRWMKKEEDLRSCHVLYVTRSAEKRYARILEGLRGASTLTIGESTSFLDAGGAVYFFSEQSGLHFEVNLGATDEARLKLSSRVLVLAHRIHHKTIGSKS